MSFRQGEDGDHPPVQGSLLGFESTSRLTDRLFFALFPDAQTAQRIAQLAAAVRERRRLRGKALATDRFHVTLHHLGDFAGVPPGVVTAARDAAATVDAPQFDVTFDRVACFSRRAGNKPVVLRTSNNPAELMSFQQTLGEALKRAGLGRSLELGFTPHLTLLYDDRGMNEDAVDPVRWTAREFVLVHSLLGKTVHRHLARWPLREG